jgi:hypothetical protein
VALGAGVRVTPLLYTQLGIYVALPFAILANVPEREGGAAAMAVSAALPLLTFFAWLEHRSPVMLPAAFTLAALGTSLILAGDFTGWVRATLPVFERARASAREARATPGPRRLDTRAAPESPLGVDHGRFR